MAEPTIRFPYRGQQRKLALAFDVGTKYSGISYSILDPGAIPEIKHVNEFPRQDTGGGTKVPTAIYYDRSGKVRAIGAEVQREGIHEIVEDQQWIKGEWFRLHPPKKVRGGRAIKTVFKPPLPLNKTPKEVYANFLRYLLECASSYISRTHANGPELWAAVKDQIDFVLSHPNGWEGAEQSEMRKAAVLAGLITDNVSGHARLSFVTKDEASLHFSIHCGPPSGTMKNGDGAVVVDAGESTIDISTYSMCVRAGLSTFEEIVAPQSHFNGSVFVTAHARLYLEQYLMDSKFIDDLDHIVRQFDKSTKLRFRNDTEPQYIQFGSSRDNDPKHNIRLGRLKLQGTDVAAFFEPSIDCIKKAVLEMKSSHKSISHVILVGGFSENDWLFNQIHSELSPLGLNVFRPGYSQSVRSAGAIASYLDRSVCTHHDVSNWSECGKED